MNQEMKIVPPNYVKAVMEIILADEMPLGDSEVYNATIFHDDDCSIFKGGLCDCKPSVKVVREGDD